MATRGNRKVATGGNREVATRAKPAPATGEAPEPAPKRRGRLLGVRAYARARGVSHTAVQKAIAAGRLSRSLRQGPRGQLIDEDLANQEWTDSTNPAQQRERHRTAPERELPPAAAGQGNLFGLAENDPRGDPEERRTYADVQKRRTEIQADLLELELAEKRGRMVDRDQVGSEVLAATTHVRNEILALPDRLAAMLVGQPVDTVRKTLKDELRKSLQRLAELLEKHGPQEEVQP